MAMVFGSWWPKINQKIAEPSRITPGKKSNRFFIFEKEKTIRI